MRYLLNIVYVLLITVASPWIAYSAIRNGKYREGWRQKLFGLLPPLPESKGKRIWFHAVSVGEVNLLVGILERLAREAPDIEIAISTTTKTGFGLAKKKYPNTLVFYCPLDFSWAVSNAFQRIKPTALVLVELELWPNLLMEAGRRNIPVAIVNGRLSDRSTRGYLWLGSVMRRWMSNVSLVMAQSSVCAERFVEIGVERDCVHAVGSMKFDGARTDRYNAQTRDLAELIGLTDHEVVFVAGSTQSPEESMAIRVYQRLSTEHPQLRLILVPRHPERGNEVARLLEQSEVEWTRRSEIGSDLSRTSKKVLLVDTVGELGGWWGCAHIGFVGGSIGTRGGQNMIEPSAYGVATCFGPNTKNFRDIVEQLVQADAARVVEDEDSMYTFVKRCLEDTDYRNEIGQRAQHLVNAQRGSTDRALRLLLRELYPDSVAFVEQPFRNSNKPPTISHPPGKPYQSRRGA